MDVGDVGVEVGAAADEVIGVAGLPYSFAELVGDAALDVLHRFGKVIGGEEQVDVATA